MSQAIRPRKLACGIFAVVVLALFASHGSRSASAQNPLFPNTQPLYYSPYGQGAYGRYGSSYNLPPAFQNTQPNFIRPTSVLPYYYRSSSPGIYNSTYNYNGNFIQNSGNGSYFHPLGY